MTTSLAVHSSSMFRNWISDQDATRGFDLPVGKATVSGFFKGVFPHDPRLATLLLGFLSGCLNPVSGTASEWPTYQGDNARTAVVAESLSLPLAEQWTFEPSFPPAKGWARPVSGYGATKNKSNVDFDDAFHVVAAGDLAFFASSSQNCLYAIRAASGEIAWRFFTDASPRLAPALWKGKVYLGADDGKVTCLDQASGEVIWQFDAAPPNRLMLGNGRFSSARPIRSGVALRKGIAYFTAGLFPSEGVYLFALEAESGTLLWKRRLEEAGNETPSPQGYPLLNEDSIFLPSRVEPTRWSLSDGSPDPFTTPIPPVKDSAYRYHNGGSYAVLWEEKKIVYGQAAILGFDPDKEYEDKYGRSVKGERLFHWFNARRIVFRGDTAWVGTDYHVLSVKTDQLGELAQNECHEFEEAYKAHRVATSLTGLEEIATHGEDTERGQAIRNGNLKYALREYEKWPPVRDALFEKFARKTDWMLPVKANESMILAGDTLICGGEDFLVAIDATSGRETWRFETGSRVRGLAVSGGRLYVSTIDGRVRCLVPHGDAGDRPRKTPNSSPLPEIPDQSMILAREILASEKAPDSGLALILGEDAVNLAIALARESHLEIHVLEDDPETLDSARTRLEAAGLHGGRITIHHLDDSGRLPFGPYLFNLVVAGEGLDTNAEVELLRVVRPYGGQAFLRNPNLDVDLAAFAISRSASGIRLTRQALEGAKNWTHNHGTPANLYSNDDTLVEGPFNILWYGEPGPRKRVDRHATAPMPLVIDGIMVLEGYDTLLAYDIYNGLKYWERWIPGTTRTGLPVSASNLVADANSVFVVAENRTCLQLDLRSGNTLRQFEVPPLPDREFHYWGWIAKVGSSLFGSRSDHDERRSRALPDRNHAVFALDADSEDLKWIHEGEGIDHDSIAIGEGKLVLIETNLDEADREKALADTVHDSSIEDRPPIDRKGQPIAPDLRRIVVLDSETGAEIWSRPFNLSDLTLDDSVVGGSRGYSVLSMISDGVLIVCGQGSLGHPYREYTEGEFARRAIYAFDLEKGHLLWGGRKNYRKRPIISGGVIFAEPHAWELKTGEKQQIINPLNGEPVPLDFLRSYSGCGHLIASGTTLFGNAGSGGMAHYNVKQFAGYTPMGNMQLACGTNAVPAGGVFVAPEGRSGCTCATPIYTSIVLYPDALANSWSHGAGGAEPLDCLPIRAVAINLGAPGFRTDASGQLWLPYPARRFQGRFSEWLPSYQHDASMCFRDELDLLPVEADRNPWLYASGYAHDKELSFALLDPERHPERTYTVRLHFAEPDPNTKEGERLFDVRIQGEPVARNFDIVREAGRARKSLIREFTGISAKDSLNIKLDSLGSPLPPLLNAIEITAE